MSRKDFPQDRFDAPMEDSGRVGAHRAENPRLRGLPIFLWALLATAILVTAGIFGTLIATGRVVLFPDAGGTPSVTESADVTPVLDTTYTVLVLNATTESGLATRLRDDLIGLGFPAEGVLPGDASSTDFLTTTVYYPLLGDRAAALGLAEAIGGADVAQSANYQPADVPDAAQLVVVIGQDRTVAGVPTTETPEE